jgi:hypothetical protein
MVTPHDLIIRIALVSCVLVGFLVSGSPSIAHVLPPIITPSPGSTLTTPTVTFTGGHASQPGEEHWLSVGYGKSAFVTKDSLFTPLAINRRFSHYRHALIVATP